MILPISAQRAMSAADDLKKLDTAAKALEAGLFKTMLEIAEPKNGMFGKSSGAEIFSGMRREEMAKTLADSNGLGLAKQIDELMAPAVIAQHTRAAAHQAKQLAANSAAARALAKTDSSSIDGSKAENTTQVSIDSPNKKGIDPTS